MDQEGKKDMYVIYGKTQCTYCTNAVTLLQSKGISFTYYSMDNRTSELLDLATQYNHRTVPIVIKVVNSENEFIGGYDALRQHIMSPTEK